MRVVTGRGHNRRAFTFPCATIVNRSSVEEQRQGKELLCAVAGIPVEVPDPVVQA